MTIENQWNDIASTYRDNMSYSEYWSKRFQNALMNASNIHVLSTKVQIDIWNNGILQRLLRLTEYDDLTVLQYENILSSWINLLNEWCLRKVNKYMKTYLYIAKVKYHPNFRKIGITWNLDNRQMISNNRYHSYSIIHEYDNRYAAAYAEYKVRTKYCRRETELVNYQDIQNIDDYVNTIIHDNHKELELLGWNYNGI